MKSYYVKWRGRYSGGVFKNHLIGKISVDIFIHELFKEKHTLLSIKMLTKRERDHDLPKRS